MATCGQCHGAGMVYVTVYANSKDKVGTKQWIKCRQCGGSGKK